MERLTVKRKDGRWALANSANMRNIEMMDKIPLAINRLADYEDAEEAGLLLRLPCKVGDIVYRIEINTDACDDCDEYSSFYGMDALCGGEEYSEAVESMKCKKLFREVVERRFSLCFWETQEKNYKKEWFLTREEAEEAEAALKEG